MRMLNICILQTNLPSDKIKSGGEERFTVEFAERLSQRHKVTILTKGDRNHEEVRGNLTIKYISCTNIVFLRFLIYIFLLVKEARKIERMDILQAHIADTANGVAGIFVSRLRGVPLFTRVSLLRYVETLHIHEMFLYRIIFMFSHIVISINNNMMKDRIKRIWSKSRIIVLPHGIDIKKTSPKKLKTGPHKLLYVGRFVWFKNTGMLVRIMGEVVKKRKDVRMIMVGTGPEREKVIEMVKECGLERYFVFTGELSHEEVMKYMEDSDVFVFPSLDEPRGKVITEAMAKGMPIVAVNRGGPKDILNQGINGFLVEPEEFQKAAERILEILSNKGLFEAMSSKNLRDVKRFSWNNVLSQFESAYMGILRERRKYRDKRSFEE